MTPQTPYDPTENVQPGSTGSNTQTGADPSGYRDVPPADYGVPGSGGPGFSGPGFNSAGAPPQYAGGPFRGPAPDGRSGAPNPVIAAVLGFIPGVGAMYNGQYGKGVVHLIVFAVLVSLTDQNGIFGLFIMTWEIYQAIEAYHTAQARRFGTPLPNPFGLNDIGERLGFGRSWPGGLGPFGAPPSSPFQTPGQTPFQTPGAPNPPYGSQSAAQPSAASAQAPSSYPYQYTDASRGPDPQAPFHPAEAHGVPPVQPGAWSEYGAPSQPGPSATATGYPPPPNPAGYAAPFGGTPIPGPPPVGMGGDPNWGAPTDSYNAASYNTSNTANRYGGPMNPGTPPIYGMPNLGAARLPTGAVVLIALGTLFLLGNIHVLHIYFGEYLLSAALIGFGLFAFVTRMQRTGPSLANDGSPGYTYRVVRAASGSSWLVLLGILFFLDRAHLLRLNHSWPLFIILWGVLALLRRQAFAHSFAAGAYPGAMQYGGVPGQNAAGQPYPYTGPTQGPMPSGPFASGPMVTPPPSTGTSIVPIDPITGQPRPYPNDDDAPGAQQGR